MNNKINSSKKHKMTNTNASINIEDFNSIKELSSNDGIFVDINFALFYYWNNHSLDIIKTYIPKEDLAIEFYRAFKDFSRTYFEKKKRTYVSYDKYTLDNLMSRLKDFKTLELENFIVKFSKTNYKSDSPSFKKLDKDIKRKIIISITN